MCFLNTLFLQISNKKQSILPANIAKRPCVPIRFSNVGFSLESVNVEDISRNMNRPPTVDLISTGISSAATRLGMTQNPRPYPVYAKITQSMGMKFKLESISILDLMKEKTDIARKDRNTRLPVARNNVFLG